MPTALCASAFGIFLMSFLKTTRQAGIVFGGVVTATGMLVLACAVASVPVAVTPEPVGDAVGLGGVGKKLQVATSKATTATKAAAMRTERAGRFLRSLGRCAPANDGGTFD